MMTQNKTENLVTYPEIDLPFITETAREAGQRAKAMLGTMQQEFKADDSLVTNIDRTMEAFIKERLTAKYPDFAFLGEETGLTQNLADLDAPLWAVDPIDGTTNMVFGIPIWGVSIGLIVGGVAVAGAFAMPMTDELFYGEIGKGSYCNGVRLRVTDREGDFHPEDTLCFTSTSIQRLPVSRLTGRLRCLGSIAADIAYTGRGSCLALVGWNERAYDIAAAVCIAKEAGCVVRHFTGQDVNLGEVVANGGVRPSPFIVAPPNAAAHIVKSLTRV